jgi:hypothetical protein
MTLTTQKFLIVFAVMAALLWALFGPPAHAEDAAIGDSLAQGFGWASHMQVIARVGEPSCPNKRRIGILNMVPARHFDFVLLSAGTNDVPGRCVAAIRAKLNAAHVMFVVPANGARQTVLEVARAYGDQLLFYTPGRRSWPHPDHYWNVRKP